MGVTIDDIKNGRVQLRCGRNYHFVGISRDDDYPVIGEYIDEFNTWETTEHSTDGQFLIQGDSHALDLILKPEFVEPTTEMRVYKWVDDNGVPYMATYTDKSRALKSPPSNKKVRLISWSVTIEETS